MALKRMNWSKEEEDNLALAWVSVSEELDTQMRNDFWVNVEMFSTS